MASIGFVIGSAIVNGLAFSASNYVFSGLNENDKKRHDLAVEKLEQAQEEYDRKRIEANDYKAKMLENQRHADKNFVASMEAIEEYNQVTRRPVLSDFYQPSQSQKMFELVWICVGTGLTYFAVKKFYH